MIRGRALENLLANKGISKDFEGWIAIVSLRRTGRSGDSKLELELTNLNDTEANVGYGVGRW